MTRRWYAVPAVAVAVGLAVSGVAASQFARAVVTPSSWVNATISASAEGAQEAVAQGQVTATLAARGAAIRHHDAKAFRATVAPEQDQAAWFRHVTSVPFRQFTLAPHGQVTGPVSDGRLSVVALLRYRLPGDAHATDREVRFEMRRVASGWAVVSSRAEQADIWDLGPVRVARARNVLVLGNASRAAVSSIANASEHALHAVEAVWPYPWQRRATVVLPANEAGMGRLIDLPDDELGGLAAVTTGEAGITTGTALRVTLNPAYYFRMSAVARQIVLRHEFTHLAQHGLDGNGFGQTPTWLREGLADYVGYQDSGVAFSVVASDLLARVREGYVVALPSDRSFGFAKSSEDRSIAYRLGWTACVYLAHTYGEPALFEFYRDVATGYGNEQARLGRALRSSVHTSLTAFIHHWRHWLRQQS